MKNPMELQLRQVALGLTALFAVQLLWSGLRLALQSDPDAPRDLDYLIDRLQEDPMVDQLRIRRLKKRKLLLKDMITTLESEMIPDMDA